MTFGGTTYLELSEANGSAHKFYEVAVAGTQVTIRYGRIGEAGQTQVSSFPTTEKAAAAAGKKVAEKMRKGYAPAVLGARAKRQVTRRAIVSVGRKNGPKPASVQSQRSVERDGAAASRSSRPASRSAQRHA